MPRVPARVGDANVQALDMTRLRLETQPYVYPHPSPRSARRAQTARRVRETSNPPVPLRSARKNCVSASYEDGGEGVQYTLDGEGGAELVRTIVGPSPRAQQSPRTRNIFSRSRGGGGGDGRSESEGAVIGEDVSERGSDERCDRSVLSTTNTSAMTSTSTWVRTATAPPPRATTAEVTVVNAVLHPETTHTVQPYATPASMLYADADERFARLAAPVIRPNAQTPSMSALDKQCERRRRAAVRRKGDAFHSARETSRRAQEAGMAATLEANGAAKKRQLERYNISIFGGGERYNVWDCKGKPYGAGTLPPHMRASDAVLPV